MLLPTPGLHSNAGLAPWENWKKNIKAALSFADDIQEIIV